LQGCFVEIEDPSPIVKFTIYSARVRGSLDNLGLQISFLINFINKTPKHFRFLETKDKKKSKTIRAAVAGPCIT
jgi:hypothetical protein